jgi:hypothetical protein
VSERSERAPLMLVGESPLDEALERAGIDRARAYVTTS